jgi:hypothetical protein
MIFTATFTVCLGVKNPFAFDAERESEAIMRVREEYKGRCYRDKYIYDIVAVVNISRCALSLSGPAGEATVNVTFEAECSRLNVGDCIGVMDVRVRGQILTGEIVGPRAATHPAVLSMINPSETFAKGNLLPVRILHVQYPPNAEKPTAAVEFLTCRKRSVVWEVVSAAGEGKGEGVHSAQVINNLGKALEGTLAARAKIAENPDELPVRDLFRKCLSTYKVEGPTAGGGGPSPAALEERLGGKTVDFPLDTAAAVQAWKAALVPGTRWVCPLEKAYDWAGVQKVDAAAGTSAVPPGNAAAPCDHKTGTATVVFGAILERLADRVQLLNDLTVAFRDPAVAKAHYNVLRLMLNEQLPGK